MGRRGNSRREACRHSGAWLALTLLLALVSLHPSASLSAAERVPSTEWILDHQGRVFAVSLGAGEPRLIREFPARITLHAAESETVHWVFAEGVLHRIDLALPSHRVIPLANFVDSQPWALTASPLTGTAVVISSSHAVAVDADGFILGERVTPSLLTVTVDSDGLFWALTENGTERLSVSLQTLEVWGHVVPSQGVTDFAVDSYRDIAWLLEPRRLTRIQRTGEQVTATGIELPHLSDRLSLDALEGDIAVLGSEEQISFAFDGSRSTPRERMRVPRAAAQVGTAYRVVNAPPITSTDLQIVQPPNFAPLWPPLPSLFAKSSRRCDSGSCQLPRVYWSRHSARVSIDGVQQEGVVVDPESGNVNLGDLGASTGSTVGWHEVQVAVIDAEGRDVATAQSYFNVQASADQRIQPRAGSAPTVTLTAPSSGAVFNAPATIALAATASDSDGTITKVEFLRGSTLLASDTTNPYTYTWANVAAGTYTLYAKATDNAGLSTTSLGVNVVVNALPTVKITAPAANAVFTAGSIVAITTTATDADGTIAKVDFYAGTTLLGTKSASPFSFNWTTASAGTFSLTAKATDNRGAVVTSTAVSIIVNTAPTVTLTAPSSGAIYAAPATIPLQATASDSDGTVAKVEFYNGATKLSTDTSSPYSFNWMNVATGTYTLTAKATDNRGLTATSAGVTVGVVSPPAVTLTSPIAGASFQAPTKILFKADASTTAGTVSKVEFFANGTLAGSATSPPYEFIWNNPAAGQHTVYAKATTSQGLTSSTAGVSFTIVEQGPFALEVSPVSSVDGDRARVTGTLTAPANTSVRVNGIAGLVGEDGFFYVDDVPLVPGGNQIQVSASTMDGRTTSQTITATSSGTPTQVRLIARPNFGPAPLRTRLKVVLQATVQMTRMEVDAFGDGNYVDHPLGDPVEVIYYYPGTYLPSIRITDNQQRTFVASTTIVVRDAEAMALTFESLWSGLNNALATRDYASANRFLTENAVAKFASVFTLLGGDLPAIVSSYGTFYLRRITPYYAEFVLTRISGGSNKAFLIYFHRDTDGAWRIEEM